MEKTIDGMLDYIKMKTEEWWEKNRSPYLVSHISPDLNWQGVNWRDIVGADIKLAKFLQDNSSARFKVVSHPLHRAKVGLIPVGENYEFPPDQTAEDSPPPHKTVSHASRDPRFVVLNFLNALSELGDEDIDKIQIPVSVLVKLIARR